MKELLALVLRPEYRQNILKTREQVAGKFALFGVSYTRLVSVRVICR